MIVTHSNPSYRCADCNTVWKSRPITVVEDDHLILPPCPQCHGPLQLLSILSSLEASVAGAIRHDDSIADSVKQDNPAAYRRWLRKETQNWRISGKDTQPTA